MTMPTENNNQEVRMCYHCNREMGEEQGTTNDLAQPFHEDCYYDRYTSCVECGDEVDHDNTYSVSCGDNDFCRGCFLDHREDCGECGDTGSIPEREYSTQNLSRFMSKEAGKIIKSSRIFSTEIECYYPNSSTMREVASALPQPIGISGDGSLGERGVEFQTPKLKGAKGEEAIKNICKTLTENEFTVDRSAGLHVHLDGKGLLPKNRTKTNAYKIRSLWAFYLQNEEVLLSFLPPSRRGNRYCTPLRNNSSIGELQNCYTLKDIEKLWYRENHATRIKRRKENKYDNTRYAGVNLHSLFASKNAEIRFHSATLSAEKILHWVSLHQTILDRASENTLYTNEDYPLELSEKTESFFRALRLSPESESYFRERQQKFSSISTRNTEESMPSPIAQITEAVTQSN